MPDAGLRMRTPSRFEPLERRALLAHVGLDLGFGDAGYAPVDASLLVAPLPGGKVLAVGELGAVRLYPDGTLDTAFVDRGTKSDVPRWAGPAVVAGQQLFIAGVTRSGTTEQPGPNTGLFVRKLNLETGAPGSGFGANGIVTFAPVQAVPGELKDFSPASMIPTAGGGVIMSVTQEVRVSDVLYAWPTQAIVLHKLDAAGNLDKTFGNNGVVTATLLEEYDYLGPAQLVAYPDGRFVLLGGTENDPTFQRFNADGSPDTTFGGDGVVPFSDVGLSHFNLSVGKVVVQPDDKLVIATNAADISWNFSSSRVTRLNADGTLDASFGDNGNVGFGREEDAWPPSGVALDAAGRIVGIVKEAEMFRLTPGGDLDPTFDDDGFTTIPQGPGDVDEYFSIRARLAIDASGNVLLARGGVARFADGQQRVDLAANGIVHVDGTTGADTITTALAGDTLTVTFNGQAATFAAGDVVGFHVTGGAGDDRIDLAAGADFAAATVYAGEGNDSIATGIRADRIFCQDGDDTVHAGRGKDLIFGGDGNDSIWGDAGDDHVFGEYGDDSISGGDGNDRLYGGHTYTHEPDEYSSGNDGNDSLSGNAGNDRCNGQNGHDRVAGNGGRDRLFGGTASDRLFGGTSADFLYGDQGTDQLFGEDGNDRLYGDDPNDYYWADTLHGNAGDDTLFSRDTREDHLFGDGGRDTSIADDDADIDILSSIESRR